MLTLKIAGVESESIVDGPGFRFVIFAQGCPHHCPGCQNPQTHAFEGGRTVEAEKLVKEALKNPLLSGVTLSGGEPFCQAEAFAFLAQQLKQAGKHIMAYTGYTWEQLLEHSDPFVKKLLYQCDLLVDGRFEQERRNLELRFRGSSNQRIIDVQRSLKEGCAVLSAL